MKTKLLVAFSVLLAFTSTAASDTPPEDTEFVFARVQFNMTLLSLLEREAPWHHDYPFSEDFTLSMLANVTNTHTSRDSYQIVKLDSADIFKYPFLYFSEPGYMELTADEGANLRDWFNRGGFACFDDFRGVDLDNLRNVLKQVFPKRQLVKLDLSHPVFHSFYDVESLDLDPPYYDTRFEGGRPEFWGMSDEDGRLILVANQNNDLGEFFEWVDKGEMELKPAAKATKIMVNYLIYAMSH
ncbi:MAG TPA: DUF4159 domain-containing protein [Terriglobia bacterium]|nr:DUF4159 domain-containing protein [Terriglobia bacterium]